MNLKIESIRCGSDENLLTIKLQSIFTDYCMIWNIDKHLEEYFKEVSKQSHTVWTNTGKPVICCKNQTILPFLGLSVSSFDRSNWNEEMSQLNLNKQQFKIQQMMSKQGHRLDETKHKWILIREHLSLSFSYMSFAIQTDFSKQLDSQSISYISLSKRKLSRSQLDLEPINYIYDNSTWFMSYLAQYKFSSSSHGEIQLHSILERIEKQDPVALNLLFYTTVKDNKVISPIHLAISINNKRMVDILLEFLGKISNIDKNQYFYDLFPSLCKFESFYLYLDKMPYQTV